MTPARRLLLALAVSLSLAASLAAGHAGHPVALWLWRDLVGLLQ